MKTYALSFLLLTVAACTDNTPTPSPDSAVTTHDMVTTNTGDMVTTNTGDMVTTTTGDMVTAGGDMATTTTGDMASSGMVTLKLQNYLAWCTVTEQGMSTPQVATDQTFSFPTGTVVHLTGDKASSTFVWGYWVGTDGDTSASHDTSMMTTVTMNGDKLIQACCPFATGGTPCPAPM